jgi:uncharacterized membrane protein
MEKHRLELFSDGVFAIVLTLLVLDLKAPVGHGLAAVREIAPALLVHALTFAVVGLAWIPHHGALAKVTEVSTRTLLWNLLGLFWITLFPFGAKLTAERPLEALGPSFLSAAYGLYALSSLQMRRSATSALDVDPLMQTWLRRRYRTLYTAVAFTLCCAALAWLWPWLGYIPLAGSVITNLIIESPTEAQQRVHRDRKVLEPDDP